MTALFTMLFNAGIIPNFLLVIEIWNNSSSTTADFDVVTDDATVHVSGKALRPTVLNLDSRTRTVKIVTSGTGRVAVSQVLVHP
ncbi:hypothetical protein [Streptomyces sp. NBC_00057]|uniref:hypothetical protein n=1 Tax=Streptomyces sp. NBC_00057 TaxID=2975634 RepID=UPI00325172E2